MSPLADLHAKAVTSDLHRDWRAFYQAFAGTSFVVPATDSGTLALAEEDGLTLARAWLTAEDFAAAISTPQGTADLPGDALAAMLADATIPLQIAGDAPIVLDADQLRWIADTYNAEVVQETGQGVHISAPAPLGEDVVDVLGQSVAALGPSCRGAWLVEMTVPDEESELVLVLDLADDARSMETPLAETIARAVQAVTDKRFAVACPPADSPLARRAAEIGIGMTP